MGFGYGVSFGRNSGKIFGENIRKVVDFRDALKVFNFLFFVNDMG